MNRLVMQIAVFALLASTSIMAQDDVKPKKPRWLTGVTTSEHHSKLSPVVPMKFFLPNGDQLPATFTEDVPVTVLAETSLFEDNPPAKALGVDIPNPKWLRKVSISWYINDWETKKKTRISSSRQNAVNEIVVTPLNPTGKAAIMCYASRKMRYDVVETGKTEGSYANSSVAKDVRVLDITPPTCGLEITVKDGSSAAFWVEENPPNQYPLPKIADVSFTGALVNEVNPDAIIPIQGIELGEGMIISPDQASINVNADDVLILRVNGKDNYKLDNSKLKYGICNGAGGEPSPISEVSAAEIDLAKLNLQERPHLYVDATDTTGNRQILFVPLKIK